MIKMIFGGGLGNQMFQYAFLFSEMHKRNNENIEAVMHRNANEDRRNFTLDNFSYSLTFDVVDEETVKKEQTRYTIKRKIICNLLKIMGFDNTKTVSIMSKLGIVFTPNVYEYYPDIQIKKNSIIEGAFQNWRYFENVRELLKSEFVLKQEPSLECKKYIDMMEESNSVCVHIRRGDYLNSHYAATLAVCDDLYYKKAIEIIEKEIKNPEFFVFTNTHEDHLWIQENYRFKGNVHYVDLNNPDYIEMYLMSKCKHFIISNSTFSWWAQYLSKSDNKLVVAPSIWYRGNDAAKEIYMPGWRLVEVE